MQEPTAAVARFVSEFASRDLDKVVVARAKTAALDWIGAALAGAEEPGPSNIHAYANSVVDKGVSVAIGRPGRLAEEHAALYNGTAGHALDFDNSAESVYGFVSSPVMPVCIALGASLGRSGEDVLRAYIVGVELACKLGHAMPRSHYDSGWHSTPTIGSMGAAAAGAYLLRLDAEHTECALGIAASLAGGLRQNYGTDTKPFHAGSAARNGYIAARLAAQGMTADRQIMESKHGYLSVFSAGGQVDLEPLYRLGEPYEMVEPGLKFRRFPCCAGTHRPLDALTELMAERQFKAADVDAINCGVIYRTVTTLMRPNPRTGLEAKFSLPYCLARKLLSGELTVRDFSVERIYEPQVRDIMRRVRMYVHPEGAETTALDHQFAELEVVLNSGERLTKRVYAPKGTPQNPLSPEELDAKFMANATQCVSRSTAEAIRALVWGLDAQSDIGELTELLANPEIPEDQR